MSFEPNPVLLFELRQAVRNRSVLVLLALYLVALALLSAWALAFPSDFESQTGTRHLGFLRNYPQVSERLAQLLFLTYYSFTTVTLVGFAAFRTATDRLRENPAYDTALPAYRLVLGKLLFGTVVSLLFLSVTFPFLTVVYQLRGVDVRLFFWAAFYFFCMTQLQYFTTVTLFSGAKTVARIVMLSLPAAFLQFFMTFFSIEQIPRMIYYVNLNAGREPVVIILMMFLIAGVPMLVLFLVCCVQFSPESSNRMMPVRITLTAIQILLSFFLVGVAVDSSMKGATGYSDGYSYAVVPNMLYWFTFPYLFAVFICERETWSPRIRRQIPRSELRRMLAFPFFTGVPNAVVWSLLSLLLIAPLPVAVYLATKGSFPEHFMAGIFGGFSFGLLFFDYCATTLSLYNLLFHRWLSRQWPRQWNWLPLFLLLAVPVLGLFFLSVVTGLGIEPNAMPFLPLPWFPESAAFVITQWMIALVWTAVLVVIGLPWLRRHYREFQPLDPMARQEKEPEASASG